MRRNRLLALAFPGDRRVWLVAAAIGALFAILVGQAVLSQRGYFTGTSSVRTVNFTPPVPEGAAVCTSGLDLPAETARIEVELLAPEGATLGGRLRVEGEGTIESRAQVPPGRHKAELPIPTRPADPASVPASLCLEVEEGEGVTFGGTAGIRQIDRPLTIDGEQLEHRLAVWYRPAADERRNLISLAPEIARRASLFRPGFVGPWTYWLIALLVMPALIYAALRLLADPVRSRRLPLALAVGLLAFGHAATWALVTPAFNSPDESEHFSYAQYLAETGNATSAGLPEQSAEATVAFDGLKLFSWTETLDGRPPWLALDEQRWRERERSIPVPRDNGGGLTTATQSHTPLYYGLLVPPYLAFSDASIFSRLAVMRLTSALLGALVAIFAFLTVRELVPRRPALAVAAGLLVAFQPMFAFMSASVNNDMGVNAAAAALLYVVVRALMRGLTVPLGIAMGALFVITPLMKFSGYAIMPALVFALVVLAWREWRPALSRERRQEVVREHRGAWIALAATVVGLTIAWGLVSTTFDRTTFSTPEGNAPVVGTFSLSQLSGYVSYTWQVFLPKLPFMNELWPGVRWPAFEIYGIRGWAAFGWYAITFPRWVYVLVNLVSLGVAALAIAALWRRRRAALRIWAPVAALAIALVSLVVGIHFAYYKTEPRAIAEQGRYVFPAIIALTGMVVAAGWSLRREWVVPIVTGAVCLVLGFAYAAQLMALTGFYT